MARIILPGIQQIIISHGLKQYIYLTVCMGRSKDMV